MINLRLLMMGDFWQEESRLEIHPRREKKKKVSGNGSVEEGNVDRGLERRGSWSKAFLSREIMDRSQVGLS